RCPLFIRACDLLDMQNSEDDTDNLAIHFSPFAPHSEGALKHDSAPRLPYRFDIWRRKKMVLSVDYDAGRQIEATFFAPGVWEYEVEWLAKQPPASPAASNTAA